MKTKALNKINDNINSLKSFSSKDASECWLKEKLLTKYRALQKFLHEESELDMERFCAILEHTQKELDAFLYNYLESSEKLV